MTKQDSDLVKDLRAQAAKAREESATFDALFSSLGEGLIAINEKGHVTRVNQAALDMLGYTESELLGEWYPEKVVMVNEDNSVVETIDRPVTQVFMTGKAISVSKYYRRKDGEKFPVFMTVSPILLRNKPIGAIEVFRDISDDIEADKMKTEFISIASHQLRTPLSAVNTYSLMLENGYAGELNEQQSTFLAVIIAATDRMNRLISTLLNITRIEAGNISVESSPIDLSILVRSIASEFEPQINQKLSLKTKIEDKIPEVNTDKLIVREIISNLVSNAIKYTPEGGLIEMSLYTDRKSIIFQVRDTGYGIPEGSKDQIFSKFYRASNAVKQEVSGTGLGLYMVKVLAEKVDGDTWFESQEGKGSSFYFSISKKGISGKSGAFKLENSRIKRRD